MGFGSFDGRARLPLFVSLIASIFAMLVWFNMPSAIPEIEAGTILPRDSSCPEFTSDREYVCSSPVKSCSIDVADCEPPFGVCSHDCSVRSTVTAVPAKSTFFGKPSNADSVKCITTMLELRKRVIPMGRVFQDVPTFARTVHSAFAHGLQILVGPFSVYGRVLPTTELGNALSPYFNGLGLAVVAGLPFVGEAFNFEFPGHFVNFLPSSWKPPSTWHGDAAKLHAACPCQLREFHEEYFHKCLGTWSEARGVIRSVLRSALERSGLAAKAAADFPLPGEVLIHQRCGHQTFLRHAQYGPPSFSLYRAAIRPTTPRITFLQGPDTAKAQHCAALTAEIAALARSISPNVRVRVMEGTRSAASVALDFARLVYAPVLVRAPSSLTMWAAMGRASAADGAGGVRGAGNGTGGGSGGREVVTYSAPQPESAGWTTAALGDDWEWVQAAQVLVPESAERLFGADFRAPSKWPRILDWLKEN